MECRPAFDYGRKEAGSKTPFGVRFSHGELAVDLVTPLDVRVEEGAADADFVLREGDEIPVVLAQSDGGRAPRLEGLGERCQREFRRTLRFWQTGSCAATTRAAGGRWSSARVWP